jgi:D-threo-aldose 1-dehydrogenase
MNASGSATTPLERRRLGTTDLWVTPICVGTSPLGSMPRLYGYEVQVERAVATVQAVLDSPIRFMDTSNGYGDGESERRIGEAIRRHGGLPEDFVLATKVDPDPATGDFSAARVRTSVLESLTRLGVDKLQLLYIHDPERISFEEAMAADGPVRALMALRDEGLVDHLGVAGGPVEILGHYISTDIFDVVLTHNRYTLLDRSADQMINEARRRQMGVVNAAPYGGGMLAKGPAVQPRYAYGQGVDEVRDHALAMQAACREYGVPLAAAALQFSVHDPRMSSTVVGISAPERIQQTLGLLDHPIPEELWNELLRLVPPRAQWLA